MITGGCAEMPGIKELALKTLGGPVRIAYPSGIAGLPSQLRKPAFSTAVGLLLWGIKHQGEKRSYRSGDKTSWSSRFQWGKASAAEGETRKAAADRKVGAK